MSMLTLTIHVVVIAFLAWGGFLSLQCILGRGGIGFPSRELRPE